MKRVNIKICGMRDAFNITEAVELMPDYIGFILYPRSPRFIEADAVRKLAHLIPSTIFKIGVMVDEPLSNAKTLAVSGTFDLFQLHGNEDIDYCRELSRFIDIIKVFRINEKLPEDLADYMPYCSLFLFDTDGPGLGGNGKKFNHHILMDYKLKTRFILAGGISAEDTSLIRNIKNDSFSGVDLNSRFEIEPGIKDIAKLKEFIKNMRKL